MFQAQSMLMMRLLLRINHMLRMPYPLLSHLTMSRSSILRQTQRRMTMRPEDGSCRYSCDGGDDGDDEDGSSEDDEDDDMDIEADDDEEEEEEYLAPTDSVVVALPTTYQAPSAERRLRVSFETDVVCGTTPPPHPAYRVTARIFIPAPVPTLVWSDAEVARLLAISTLPSSPLPQIPSPSLPLSPPLPVLSPAPPPSPIRSLGYRAAMIQIECTYLGIPPPLPISVPTSSPPLLLPSASRREDRPEVTLPPRKRLGIALGPGYEVGESSSAAAARPARGLRADYGFVATIDREIRHDSEERLEYGITILVGRADCPTRLWGEGRSMDASDLAREEVMSLRTTVLGQMLEIRELHVADHRRQAVISKMLKADQRRSAKMRELRTANHNWTEQPYTEHDQDNTDPLEVLHSQSCKRRLVAVHRLDHVMASHFVYSLLSTEGVVELTQWFERMETVFRISNCPVENQVKFSTCTLLAGALTWWNSHVMTVSHDAAYAMTWADLRKKMTDKYCSRNEMKKLEAELWNLKVKGTDVIGYNQHFQELALLCVRMFPEESDKIERYVSGLPDMIHGNIVALKPKTMQEAVEMANELMDNKVSTIAERQSENKWKFENTSRNNQNQQKQNKRQNTGRAYTAGTSEKKPYGGSKPLCAKCNYHHDGFVKELPTDGKTIMKRHLRTVPVILLASSVEFKDTSGGNAQR
ncbi:reverse transcriptase domain-containing protein [Tanacetum coccineum]